MDGSGKSSAFALPPNWTWERFKILDLGKPKIGWLHVKSKRSGKRDDAPTSVVCPVGTILTDCNCYSPWKSCDGAKASGNKCTAYNGHKGQGVFAYARCGPIP